MEPTQSNVSGPDWVATQIERERSAQPARLPRPDWAFQAWAPAALLLGLSVMLFSAIAHVVAWLYVSLAPSNMSDTDTRLGLAVCIVYAVLVLLLAILAIVSGALGLHEARRLNFARGLAVVGQIVACTSLVFWLMAATNLLIVAIARLR